MYDIVIKLVIKYYVWVRFLKKFSLINWSEIVQEFLIQIIKEVYRDGR